MCSSDLVLYGYKPNPFQSETTIELEIAEQTKKWTLAVYNTQGQLIYEERKNLEPGKHAWNIALANQGANGLYWYTLTAEDEQLTGKMILQK